MPLVVNPAGSVPGPAFEAISPDGILHVWADFTRCSVRMRCEFPVPYPPLVRFERGDGTPVRGGDPVRATDGVSYAYDQEIPLGTPASYRVVALDADEQVIMTSEEAVIVVPEATGTGDVWIRSLEDPSLSMRIAGRFPLPEVGESARLSLNYALDARYPGGAIGKRTAAPVELLFWIATTADRQAMSDLLDSGHLFIQFRSTYGVPDFYAAAGDHRIFPGIHKASDIRRDGTVNLTPMSRPPTIDSPAYMPGFSVLDIGQYTVDEAAAIWTTVEHMAGF